jgi:hypothetical protein
MLAGFNGTFQAKLTPQGACAWLQPVDRLTNVPAYRGAYLWPAGYRVRSDPTELLNPHGRVVDPVLLEDLTTHR